MPLPYPTIISDIRPDPDPWAPSEAPPSPDGIKATDLMPGSQVPKPRGQHYSLSTGEVRGLEVDFRGHQGWIRVGCSLTYTDGSKLDLLHLARQERLVQCRKDFESLQETYKNGPEAAKVKDLRNRLAKARQKEAEARQSQAAAKAALHASILDDLPLEEHEEAHTKAGRLVMRAQIIRSHLENRLTEAIQAYEEGWQKARDQWVMAQTEAATEKERALEERMIEDLAQKAAQLEGQQALISELSSSYYSSSPSPEIAEDPITSQVTNDWTSPRMVSAQKRV